MSESEATHSKDDDQLKDIFDHAMKLFKSLDDSNEETGSETKQRTIKTAISNFENATNLVSLSGMFSKNESIEELPTEHLQYLLLPALLGTLVLKITGQSRMEHITVAEVYFKDFLQRCKDYGVTDVEIPQPSTSQAVEQPLNEKAKITQMVQSREAKIKRYKEMKQLESKLSNLSKAMSEDYVDDETKREYFITMLHTFVNQALDELNSIEQEKPILEYMAKNGPSKRAREAARPLRPVTITREALRAAVLGAGYPAPPTLSVEQFYEQRVRDGLFPSASNIPHRTLQNPDADEDEDEEVRKERLVEEEDPEELQRQRNMDEYKDDHRRGWGNRYNRS